MENQEHEYPEHEAEARERANKAYEEIFSEPKEPLIEKITDAIVSVVNCRRIYLFGSYVYGNFKKESDLDFYVVLFNEEKESIFQLRYKINRELTRRDIWYPIDILMNTEKDFSQVAFMNGFTLEKKVYSEGRILFDAQEGDFKADENESREWSFDRWSDMVDSKLKFAELWIQMDPPDYDKTCEDSHGAVRNLLKAYIEAKIQTPDSWEDLQPFFELCVKFDPSFLEISYIIDSFSDLEKEMVHSYCIDMEKNVAINLLINAKRAYNFVIAKFYPGDQEKLIEVEVRDDIRVKLVKRT